MELQNILEVLFIGSIGGFLSGLLGIGGGVIMVPALVFCCALEQKMAQSTVILVNCLPIGALLSVRNYRKKGHIPSLKDTFLLAIGFASLCLVGGRWATQIDDQWLKKIFAILLILIGLKILIFDKKLSSSTQKS